MPLQRYAQALINLDVAQSLQTDLADLMGKTTKLKAQAGLDSALLSRQIMLLRQRCGETGVMWRDSWDPPLEVLTSMTSEDLISLDEMVKKVSQEGAQTLAEGTPNVWVYQRFRQHFVPALQHPFWDAVAVLASIQSELLETARARYRRDGKLLYGTEAYRGMLNIVRSVRKEIENGR